jgi:hypothetical protein
MSESEFHAADPKRSQENWVQSRLPNYELEIEELAHKRNNAEEEYRYLFDQRIEFIDKIIRMHLDFIKELET